MDKLLAILGASDPEMQASESLLVECGITVAYAVGPDGERVHPGNAYRAVGFRLGDEILDSWEGPVLAVECGGDAPVFAEATVIDHHREGDPGFGLPPARFLEASSIGQLIALLNVAQIPKQYVLAAAADHCLASAYAGQCPGVDPDELMRWRIESRAAFQGRSAEEILADVERARKVLREAVAETYHPILSVYCPQCDADHPDCYTGGRVSPPYADLRGQHIPELPEAAAREGIPFLASVKDRDGREKVVLQVATPSLVQDFLDGNIVPSLVDTYGDPARGFAGGYVPR